MGVVRVTDVELVATALATGAVAGSAGPSRGVVHDLHDALREAVLRGLARGRHGVRGDHDVPSAYGVRVLNAYAADPDVWRTRLLQVLSTGVEMDEEILTAARAVIRADRRAGRVSVGEVGS